MKVFDLMWDAYPMFRRSMYSISCVWAAVFLLQAGVTAVIIAATSFDTGYLWDQILPIAAFTVAIGLTIPIARHAKAVGERARQERDANDQQHEAPSN